MKRRAAVMDIPNLQTLTKYATSRGYQGNPLAKAELIITHIGETVRCAFLLRSARAWAVFTKRAEFRFFFLFCQLGVGVAVQAAGTGFALEIPGDVRVQG